MRIGVKTRAHSGRITAGVLTLFVVTFAIASVSACSKETEDTRSNRSNAIAAGTLPPGGKLTPLMLNDAEAQAAPVTDIKVYQDNFPLVAGDLLLLRHVFDSAAYTLVRNCMELQSSDDWSSSESCRGFQGLRTMVQFGIARENNPNGLWTSEDTRALHADGRVAYQDFLAVQRLSCEDEDSPLLESFSDDIAGITPVANTDGCIMAQRVANYFLANAYKSDGTPKDPAESRWVETMRARPGRQGFESLPNAIDLNLVGAAVTKWYVKNTPELIGKIMDPDKTTGGWGNNDLRYIASSCSYGEESDYLSFPSRLCAAAKWISDDYERFSVIDIANDFSLMNRDFTISPEDVGTFENLSTTLITNLENERRLVNSDEAKALLAALNASTTDLAWQAYVYASKYRFARNSTPDVRDAPNLQAATGEYFRWLARYYAQFQRGAYLANLETPDQETDGLRPGRLWKCMLRTVTPDPWNAPTGPNLESADFNVGFSGGSSTGASKIGDVSGAPHPNERRLAMKGWALRATGSDFQTDSPYWAGEIEACAALYVGAEELSSDEDSVLTLYIMAQFSDLFNASRIVAASNSPGLIKELPEKLQTLFDRDHSLTLPIWSWMAGMDNNRREILKMARDALRTKINSIQENGKIGSRNIFQSFLISRDKYWLAQTSGPGLKLNLSDIQASNLVKNEHPWVTYDTFKNDLGPNFFWTRLNYFGEQNVLDFGVNWMAVGINNFPGLAMFVPGYGCASNLDALARNVLAQEAGTSEVFAYWHLVSMCAVDSLAISATAASTAKMTMVAGRIGNQAVKVARSATNEAITLFKKTKEYDALARRMASYDRSAIDLWRTSAHPVIRNSTAKVTHALRTLYRYRTVLMPWIHLNAPLGKFRNALSAVDSALTNMNSRLVNSGGIELIGFEAADERARRAMILAAYAEGSSAAAEIKTLNLVTLEKLEKAIGEMQSSYRLVAEAIPGRSVAASNMDYWAPKHAIVREMINMLKFGPKAKRIQFLRTRDHNALGRTFGDGIDPGLAEGVTAVMTFADDSVLNLVRTGSKGGAAADGEFLADSISHGDHWRRRPVAEGADALPTTSTPAVGARIRFSAHSGQTYEMYANGLGPQRREWYCGFDGLPKDWALVGEGGNAQFFFRKSDRFTLAQFDFAKLKADGGNISAMAEFQDGVVSLSAMKVIEHKSAVLALTNLEGVAPGLRSVLSSSEVTADGLAASMLKHPQQFADLRAVLTQADNASMASIWAEIGTASKSMALKTGLMPAAAAEANAIKWLESYRRFVKMSDVLDRQILKLSHFVQTQERQLAHSFHRFQLLDSKLWQKLEMANQGKPLVDRDAWLGGLLPRDLYGSIASQDVRLKTSWFNNPKLPGTIGGKPLSSVPGYRVGVEKLRDLLKIANKGFDVRKSRLNAAELLNAEADLERLRSALRVHLDALGVAP